MTLPIHTPEKGWLRINIEIDNGADAAYFSLSDLPVHHTKEIEEGFYADFAEDGTLVGIDLLYVSRRVSLAPDLLSQCLWNTDSPGGEIGLVLSAGNAPLCVAEAV